MTEGLWHDLQRAMSADEVQLLVDGWVKAKLEADAEVRRTEDRHGIDQHYAKQMEAFGGALLRKVENDPQDAKPYIDELIGALDLKLTEREIDVATKLMIRAQYDLLRALIARHTKPWRPWLDDDPAAPLLARLTANGDAAKVSAPEASSRAFGLLSVVARDAIADFARKDEWKPKRIADYETAVATLTLAFGRDPDLGEITTEVAGHFMRDLTCYPTNVTKREPYKNLATFQERVEAVKAATDDRVLAPVTINGKYLTPLRRIFKWRKAVVRVV